MTAGPDLIQLRRGTNAQWAAANPVLAAGEKGVTLDAPLIEKTGDGVTAWSALPVTGTATFEAGIGTVLYVDPAGSDANSGKIQALPKQTIAAAIAALAGGVGEIRLTPNASFTPAAGITFDVAKVRIVGKKNVLDFSALVEGTAVALTSSANAGGASYNLRSAGPPLRGVEIIGSSRTNAVTGLSVAAGAGNELAHIKVTDDVVVHGFGTGLSLGSNAHNLEFGISIYSCGHDIDDAAAVANAGERIVFVGGAFFNSLLVGYFRNGSADYVFLGSSFDYNVAIFDINGPPVTCSGCHTEGNDANYGANYPFVIAGTGSLAYEGGIITGPVNNIPAYVNCTGASARASFVDIRLNWANASAAPFSVGTGACMKSTVQTLRPFAKNTATADTVLPTAVVTTVALGNTIIDTEKFYAAGQPNRLTAPAPGFYEVKLSCTMTNAAGGTVRQIWGAINGSDAARVGQLQTFPTAAGDFTYRASEVVYLNTGDYVELHVFHDQGGNLAAKGTGGGVNCPPAISLLRVS